MRIGKRLEQHSIDDGEHYRRCADAERQRQQRDGGEPRLAAHAAQGVAAVAQKILHPARATHVAAAFFDLFEAAEGDFCQSTSFAGRMAARDQVGDVLI